MKKILCILLLLCIMPIGCSARKEPKISFLTDNRIVLLSRQEYIIGCLMGECAALPQEALNAVAVLLNTHIEKSVHENSTISDITEDTELLPYITETRQRELHGSSYEIYHEKAVLAASYAEGKVLSTDNEIICPEICLLSAGATDSSPQKPYLAAADCSYDIMQPYYISTAAFSPSMVRRSLSEYGVKRLSADESEWFTQPLYKDTGTLQGIRFGGVMISGEQLRDSLGLRSTAITVEYVEERFVFTCRGIGENRGMSLSTAAVLANQGMNAYEILTYFFNL